MFNLARLQLTLYGLALAGVAIGGYVAYRKGSAAVAGLGEAVAKPFRDAGEWFDRTTAQFGQYKARTAAEHVDQRAQAVEQAQIPWTDWNNSGIYRTPDFNPGSADVYDFPAGRPSDHGISA